MEIINREAKIYKRFIKLDVNLEIELEEFRKLMDDLSISYGILKKVPINNQKLSSFLLNNGIVKKLKDNSFCRADKFESFYGKLQTLL